MALNWQTDSYKNAVSSRGGYWDNGGAEAKTNTGWNEAVNPNNWQSGGWYTNPNSGKVERWWAAGDGPNAGGSNNGGGGSSSVNYASSFTSNNSGGGNQQVSLPQRPTIDLAKEYQSLYDSLGLQGYKDAVMAKQQEILALRDETDKAAALINENPWSSAANRTGRLAKLEDAYNRKAQVLSAQAALEQQKYTDAYNELNTQMNLKTQQYNIDIGNLDWSLNQLNSLLSLGALDNASSESLVNIASQVGMTSDMINSMIQMQKNSRMKPTLLQHTDDFGNVTATLMDANTGNIISQQSLGAIDASRLTPSSLSGGYSSSSSGSKMTKSAFTDEINNSDMAQRANILKEVAGTLYFDSQSRDGKPLVSSVQSLKELYKIWKTEMGGNISNFGTYFGSHINIPNWQEYLK